MGLSFACLRKLADFYKQGLYAHSSVKREEVKWSLEDWAQKIEKNFEAHYFIQEGSPKEKRNGKKDEDPLYALPSRHYFPTPES